MEKKIKIFKRIAEIIFYIVCILFIGWFCISYAEVLLKNLNDSNLSDWNFFVFKLSSIKF